MILFGTKIAVYETSFLWNSNQHRLPVGLPLRRAFFLPLPGLVNGEKCGHTARKPFGGYFYESLSLWLRP